MSHLDSLHCLGNRTDLIELDEDRVSASKLYTFCKAFRIGNEKVISDLARFTDGAIQLDPETFKFDKYPSRETDRKRKKK